MEQIERLKGALSFGEEKRKQMTYYRARKSGITKTIKSLKRRIKELENEK